MIITAVSPFLAVTGTATQAQTGIVTALVNDQNASILVTIKVTANPAASTLTIGDTAMLDAEVGVPYKDFISAVGGTAPFTFSLANGSSLAAGLTLNSDGTITGTPTAGAQVASTFTVKVTDQAGFNISKDLSINVVNHVAIATQLVNATVGSPYNLALQSSQGEPPVVWSGNLPTGLVLAPLTGIISGVPQIAGDFGVTIQATDSLNGTAALPAVLHVQGLVLTLNSLIGTASGFTAQFNQPFDSSVLNLYDTETGGLGPADVTVIGANTGPVIGSLVFNQLLNQVNFIRTGAPLPADTYTVTMRSATNGFKLASGTLLSGSNDGITAGDYISTFTVSASSAVVASVADFIRGPGQPVNIQASSSAGIPISLNNATGVTSVSLTFTYNPSLLSVTAVNAGAALPAGSQVSGDFSTPGQVQITVTSPTPLSSGVAEVARLTATVPSTAQYRATEILNITNVSLNSGAIAGVGDAALHVVSYFGDANGSQSYTALDGQRVLRVAAGLDSGFAAYPLIDPVIIADINASGSITAIDATRILQKVVGLDRPEIPPIPAIVGSTEALTPVSQSTPGPMDSGVTAQGAEVPYLTSSISIGSADVAAVTNSIADISQSSSSISSDASAFDDYMSDQLTKSTGRSWRFMTLHG